MRAWLRRSKPTLAGAKASMIKATRSGVRGGIEKFLEHPRAGG